MNARISGAALALTALLPLTAMAGSSVGVNVGVSNGPATIQFSFRSAPEVVYVPEQRVYVVDDDRCGDDMFRYDDRWWVVREGHWYRANHWRGPFIRVEERRVPRAIFLVPERRWKHHPHGMPPGLAKKSNVRVVSRGPDVIVVEKGRGKHDKHDHKRDR